MKQILYTQEQDPVIDFIERIHNSGQGGDKRKNSVRMFNEDETALLQRLDKEHPELRRLGIQAQNAWLRAEEMEKKVHTGKYTWGDVEKAQQRASKLDSEYDVVLSKFKQQDKIKKGKKVSKFRKGQSVRYIGNNKKVPSAVGVVVSTSDDDYGSAPGLVEVGWSGGGGLWDLVESDIKVV